MWIEILWVFIVYMVWEKHKEPLFLSGSVFCFGGRRGVKVMLQCIVWWVVKRGLSLQDLSIFHKRPSEVKSDAPGHRGYAKLHHVQPITLHV